MGNRKQPTPPPTDQRKPNPPNPPPAPAPPAYSAKVRAARSDVISVFANITFQAPPDSWVFLVDRLITVVTEDARR